MQKINKVFISLVIICLISLLMPFSVSADSGSYTVIGGSAVQVMGADNPRWVSSSNNSSEVRYVIVWRSNVADPVNGRMYYNIVGVSQNSFTLNWGTDATLGYTSSSFVNSNYYLAVISSQVGGYGEDNLLIPDYRYTPNASAQVPTDSVYEMAIYYTFGEGSQVPTNYGDLVVGFHTNFSASGTTNNYTITNNTNLDTIEWENVDSNGNDLSNKGINVEIRAVPILYSANSKSALDLLGFQDAVVDSNNGLILWQGNFNDNHKSFIWNDVIHQLQTSNPAFTITSLLTGSVWTRYGWIYQIRYNDVLNGYSSDWQTIYNSTSIKVSDSEKIVNQYYYHYPSGVGSDDQDIFHDINTVNNTTNNWYVNDVPVDPDASWLDSLIQAIAEILGKILDFFSSIFDGLVDLLLGLFGNINPADSFFNWFSDLFNGIGDIDLTLPQFNIPSADLSSFNRLVQETMDIFSLNNFGFVIFIPLLLIIIKAVF